MNYGLWFVRTHGYRLINCGKCTIVKKDVHVGNWMWDTWELSVLSFQVSVYLKLFKHNRSIFTNNTFVFTMISFFPLFFVYFYLFFSLWNVSSLRVKVISLLFKVLCIDIMLMSNTHTGTMNEILKCPLHCNLDAQLISERVLLLSCIFSFLLLFCFQIILSIFIWHNRSSTSLGRNLQTAALGLLMFVHIKPWD